MILLFLGCKITSFFGHVEKNVYFCSANEPIMAHFNNSTSPQISCIFYWTQARCDIELFLDEVKVNKPEKKVGLKLDYI